MSSESEKPRLIIDEDWKSRVQVEKEALKAQQAAPGAAGTSASEQTSPSHSAGDKASPDQGPLPPPTLTTLLTSLGAHAYVCMGALAEHDPSSPPPDLEQAKHIIDTLDMLDEKTRGNRTVEESDLLRDLLHQLHMAFVYANSQRA